MDQADIDEFHPGSPADIVEFRPGIPHSAQPTMDQAHSLMATLDEFKTQMPDEAHRQLCAHAQAVAAKAESKYRRVRVLMLAPQLDDQVLEIRYLPRTVYCKANPAWDWGRFGQGDPVSFDGLTGDISLCTTSEVVIQHRWADRDQSARIGVSAPHAYFLEFADAD